jgi:hypothetical protein
LGSLVITDIGSTQEPVALFLRSCRQLGFWIWPEGSHCVGGIETGIELCTSLTRGRLCSLRIYSLQVAVGFWKATFLIIALNWYLRGHTIGSLARWNIVLSDILVFIFSASFWPLTSSYLQQHRFLQITIPSRRRIRKVGSVWPRLPRGYLLSKVSWIPLLVICSLLFHLLQMALRVSAMQGLFDYHWYQKVCWVAEHWSELIFLNHMVSSVCPWIVVCDNILIILFSASLCFRLPAAGSSANS